MKLVIIHYHLNRGGVSRVVLSHLEALERKLSPQSEPMPPGLSPTQTTGPALVNQISSSGKPPCPAQTEKMLVVILFGGRQEGWPEDLPSRFSALRLVLEPVPLVDYDNVHHQTGPSLVEALYRQIHQVLRRHHCLPEQTLLHVHNHSLGKNVALPAVLARLAEEGYPLLLQIHDFPEDFRPANYRRLVESSRWWPHRKGISWLYPQAKHVHYTTLTTRDHQILLRAGVPADRLHRVPNPVGRPGRLPPPQVAKARLEATFGIPPSSKYVLYPVRAIRRKNLGEAILYSLLNPPGTWIGITLAPLNPAEKRSYEGWKHWTAKHRIACLWETGEPGALHLSENLAAADAFLTTSITEGFGMVFLESWMVGRPLLGRNLPEITTDFQHRGLRLPAMWERLAVPLDWLGPQRVRKRFLRTYQQVLAHYQYPMPSDWDQALEEKLAGQTVDFGDLDEPLQQEVLEKILSQTAGLPSPRTQILEKNPAVARALTLQLEEQTELLRENAQVVEEHFSPYAIGEQLWQIYQQMLRLPATGPLEPLSHPERILESFLDLRRFRMLRS